ncbi:Protein of unknown function [Gryllus bimaculatus]|nr:Protein of unknown function [Gryllus bimaculatus]
MYRTHYRNLMAENGNRISACKGTIAIGGGGGVWWFSCVCCSKSAVILSGECPLTY